MSHSKRAHPRAYLRHQRRRIIAQRLRLVSRWYQSGHEHSEARALAGSLYNALRSAETPCSCRHHCCKGPRRAYGDQSRREDMAVMTQLEQLVSLDLHPHFRPPRFSSPLHLHRQLNRLRRNLDLEKGDEDMPRT